MSEAFDVTELVLKSKAGTQLLTILKQPEIASAFISLIVRNSLPRGIFADPTNRLPINQKLAPKEPYPQTRKNVMLN